MRLVIMAAVLATLTAPALAQQQGRPQQGGQGGQRPPAQQQQQPPAPQQQQQQDQGAPGMFACRTENEICYIGVVVGGQVSVLYTTDPAAEGIEDRPINVRGADLSQHNGRVVMLVGRYDRNAGLSNAEVVDVAGPLLSFAIKSLMSGGGEEEEEPPPPQQQQRQQPQRQQPQQQRR